MTTMNNFVVADVVVVMIGLSSLLRAHKARTMNIDVVVVVVVAVAVVDDDDEDDENDDDNINAEEADIDGNGSSVSISCSSSSSSSIGLGGGGRRQQGWTDVDKDYCDGEVMMVRRRGTPTGTYEGEDKENY